MPKRIIDGEALWQSSKLAHVQPEAYRAEYANLLPLALANGTFECDARLVWAKVYAANRPSVTQGDVGAIFAEFERAKLLFRFTHHGKEWGYWIGIHKPGRLPKKSDIEKKRYEVGAPVPGAELDKFLNGDGIASISRCEGDDDAVGIGVGIGLVKTIPQTLFGRGTETLAHKGKTPTFTEAQIEMLYGLYPRRQGKLAAKKAIHKAVGLVMAGDANHPPMGQLEAVDFLAQSVTLYAEAIRGRDRQFIPYPASWFNSGSFWDDEEEWREKQSNQAETLPAEYVPASQRLAQERAIRTGGQN